MNISTILGIFLGVATVVGGMFLKGAKVSSLLNPAAIVIIFVGTFASLLNAFPMGQIKKLPAYFGIILKGSKIPEMEEIVKELMEIAVIARKEGILALEKIQFENPFMAETVGMLVDGTSPEVLEEVMEGQIIAMQDRHKSGIQAFSQAGMYAPTLGVLGAVIGLVAALGHLDDIEALGHSIAAAFIATMFGIFSGYVLWHPFANKMKQMSKEEAEVKKMIVAGILSIQAGNSPAVIQAKLLANIPEKGRDKLRDELGITKK